MSIATLDSTKIFADAADYYKKYRPTYPNELFTFLDNNILNKTDVIADIGSGTGIFSKHLLDLAHNVISIEPNLEMRKTAEADLYQYLQWSSVNATAENTTLADKSIDAIVVAQAFHWFDLNKIKIEFKRILKSSGCCILVWNLRDNTVPFMHDYENIVTQCVENYQQVIANNYISDEIILDFFYPQEVDVHNFKQIQALDLEGLKGRILSTSYAPKSGPNFDRLMSLAIDLFKRYEHNGCIEMSYVCKCYVSKLTPTRKL